MSGLTEQEYQEKLLLLHKYYNGTESEYDDPSLVRGFRYQALQEVIFGADDLNYDEKNKLFNNFVIWLNKPYEDHDTYLNENPASREILQQVIDIHDNQQISLESMVKQRKDRLKSFFKDVKDYEKLYAKVEETEYIYIPPNGTIVMYPTIIENCDNQIQDMSEKDWRQAGKPIPDERTNTTATDFTPINTGTGDTEVTYQKVSVLDNDSGTTTITYTKTIPGKGVKLWEYEEVIDNQDNIISKELSKYGGLNEPNVPVYTYNIEEKTKTVIPNWSSGGPFGACIYGWNPYDQISYNTEDKSYTITNKAYQDYGSGTIKSYNVKVDGDIQTFTDSEGNTVITYNSQEKSFDIPNSHGMEGSFRIGQLNSAALHEVDMNNGEPIPVNEEFKTINYVEIEQTPERYIPPVGSGGSWKPPPTEDTPEVKEDEPNLPMIGAIAGGVAVTLGIAACYLAYGRRIRDRVSDKEERKLLDNDELPPPPEESLPDLNELGDSAPNASDSDILPDLDWEAKDTTALQSQSNTAQSNTTPPPLPSPITSKPLSQSSSPSIG